MGVWDTVRESLGEGVVSLLARVEEVLERAAGSEEGFVSQVTHHLLQAGGKRLRPALVILAGQFGQADREALVKGAAAIELTHMATLCHDDVIDEGVTRRGRPSVNALWGNSVAVMAGDFLFARAAALAAELGPEAVHLLATTMSTLCEGQVRELASKGSTARTLQEYLETIRKKTASLMSASCLLGASLARAEEEVRRVLGAYGELFGMAFQISDDALDMVGSEEELKKPPGSDVREGVYTLPLILALQTPQGRELREILAEGPPGPEGARRVVELVVASGVMGEVVRVAEEYAERAVASLASLPASPAREVLARLARFVLERMAGA